MPRNLLLMLGLLLAPAMAEARDVTGLMTYAPRIALPEDAQLLVEMRGPEGLVAKARIETEGRQVPLPFVLVAPDAGAYSLRGAILVGGRAIWQSVAVPVPEGEAAVDLGEVPLGQPAGLGFVSRMDCGGTEVLLGFTEAGVRLHADGVARDLAPAPSASGARFTDGADPESVVWSRGNGAMVTVAGVALPDCQPMIPPPLLPAIARGNEPGWRLDMTEAGYVFEDMEGSRAEGTLPAPVPTGSGAAFAAEGLGVTLDHVICRDTMTGMPHPLTATVSQAGRTLAGCGGAPGDLLAGLWQVQLVAGEAVPEGVVSLAFDPAEGRVFGQSGCNRFNGGFTLSGEGLGFGATAGTMMACPEDLMQVEQRFLTALPTVDRFDIAPDGALELFSADRVVLRATR
jgi:heat shock protein HslJ